MCTILQLCTLSGKSSMVLHVLYIKTVQMSVRLFAMKIFFKSNLLLLFFFTRLSSVLLSDDLFLSPFLSFVLSVSLCFRNVSPIAFWFLPIVYSLLLHFQKLCVRLITEAPSSSPLIFLSVCLLIHFTQSSTGFWSHHTSLFLRFSLTHTQKVPLSSWVAWRSELACLPVSCRVTELLGSLQLSRWPISSLIHTF